MAQINLQIKPLKFYWESNKGFGCLADTFNVPVPFIDDQSPQALEAFKMGLDKYYEETRELAKGFLEAWKKNDPNIEISLFVDYSDQKVRKELNKYAKTLDK